MKPIRFEDEAGAELAAATTWYEQRQSSLGRRCLQAIETTLNQIARIPQAGAPFPNTPATLGVRRVPVKGFPFVVAYLETDDAIRILAIVHERRRPGYWLSRI